MPVKGPWLIAWFGLMFFIRADAADAPRHWAYQPLSRPPVPSVKQSAWVRTPIDAFVLRELETRGLTPSLEADRRTVLRRLSFNLTGLPPTPEQAHEFLSDLSTDAYERAVDSLLNSPRYGERWARHWMDAAHFAETHGHDQDRIRTNAWPYRDYLIASFNSDKPYTRFIEEQVAGDVLYPEEPQATVALGFLAAGPWDESSLRDIREDTLDRQIGRYLDRDDVITTVMQTFASSTVHCARCHDHKFDPISQEDYYALQAVFAGVERANRVYDPDAAVHRTRQDLLRMRRRVEAGDRSLLLSSAVEREVEAWSERRQTDRPQWLQVEPATFLSSGGASLHRAADQSLLATGARAERDTYTITATSSAPSLRAVRLEVLTDPSLPHQGPGRQDNGNFHLSEFQLFVFEPGASAAREVAFADASADFEQTDWPIRHAIDRNDKTAWGIHPSVGQSHTAVFELRESLKLSPGATLTFVLKQLHGGGHLIGRFRLSLTSDPLPSPAYLPGTIQNVLALEPSARSDEQRLALAQFVLKRRIQRDLDLLPKPALVYAAAFDFEPDGSLKPSPVPRAVHLLHRGEITQPRQPAHPGALSCVPSLPARFDVRDPNDEGIRRAALARWLSAPDNPLTWRSIVNRVWHYHFGRGLVATPNDFGRMGARPSHPELLDWLATWFRDEARGSLKQLHRLIVTSSVYRQSAMGSTQSNEVDSDNQWLSRMPRARLDAEQVRDAILQISGRLDLRMGGPSDMQFDLQPGIHVTPRVDYSKFELDSPAGRRRSVYRFLFRTLPDPFMDALDCPAGDQLTPVRNATVTVQQALALWNNAFVARHAEHFAGRLEREAQTLEGQIGRAFLLALGRSATSAEVREFATYARDHGLTNFCRLLFNSNEFVFVN